MNPFNYGQPEPTWQVLQRQYSQRPAVISVPRALAFPQPAQVNIPAAVTIGSALLYLWSDNEVVKALALQAFTVGATAWVGQSPN